MDNNPLIYGKSNISHIVGLEVNDDTVELFIQDPSTGEVNSVLKPHRYWILSDKNIDGKFVRLEGDLHYKWGRQFKTKEDWQKSRNYWRKYDTYSIYNSEEAAMVKDGYTFYRDMKQSDVSVLSFDIETTGLDPYAKDAQVLLISTTFRDSFGNSVNKLFAYDEYASESEMLNDFFSYVIEKDPSTLVGHNIISYDFFYISGRCEVLGIDFTLGRDGSAVKFNSYTSQFRLDGTRSLEYKNVSVYGREIVDTYFLSVAFDVSKAFETYALKPLIKQLGFEKEGRQYYDAGSIRDNYKNPVEWEKIKQYSIDDAEDPIKLYDHMGPLYFNMCQYISKPFSEMILSASGSKINGMMVRAYLQDKHSIPKADEVRKFAGGLSWGKPGIYKNVAKVDAISLYPSVIIEFSVYDKEKDPKAYLLQLVKTFRDNRLKVKKLAQETGNPYWKQVDITLKGILNSFFGFFGCQGLNFNSFNCADFITRKSREILQTAIIWATSKHFQEIAPDYYEEHEQMVEENE